MKRQKKDDKSSQTKAQIVRLVEMLRGHPCHTFELRQRGICHPAGRVKDLAMLGYEVSSSRINTVDADGYTHAGVALYGLISEPATAIL